MACTALQASDWRILDRESNFLQQGLIYCTYTFKQSSRVELRFVRFRSEAYSLVVLDNGNRRDALNFGSLQKAMEKSGCVAGTNGGFFQPTTFLPNGLMIADGLRTGTYDPANWGEGILAVRNGVITLTDCKTFQPDAATAQLIQTGPWLVQNGKPRLGYGDRIAQRTFIATDGDSGWILGTASDIALSPLAELLASEAMKEIFPVHTALNLDGGPSTGFWVRTNAGPVYHEEGSTVRNFIGVRPAENLGVSK